MTTITLTRHEFSSSKLFGLAKKEHRPWIRRRIKAIAATEAGVLSREAVARKFHTDSDQVRRWIRRYNNEGIKGLEDRPGKGAKRVLTRKQEKVLKKAIGQSPQKSRISAGLWTGRAVQEYLNKQKWFNCSLPEAYVLIHRLGFTLQRPGRTPIEAELAAEKQFLRELSGKKRERN